MFLVIEQTIALLMYLRVHLIKLAKIAMIATRRRYWARLFSYLLCNLFLLKSDWHVSLLE